MPTRTAMVLASNGGGSAGDPFLGALIRGGFAIAKGIGRKLFRGRKALPAPTAITRLGSVFPRLPAGVGRILRTGAGAVATGAAFSVGATIIGFNPDGTPIFGKRRRRRGITATELRGFKKVTGLLHRVGMTPRGLGRVHHRAHHHSS